MSSGSGVMKVQPSGVDSFDVKDLMDDKDSEYANGHPLALVCGLLFCPLTALYSFYTLEVNEEAVVTQFGAYIETVKDSGIHWTNCFGRGLKKVSTKKISHNLAPTKVLDKAGNPLIISAVIVYQIANVRRATLDVEEAHQFVIQQGEAALKTVVCRYPYESHDESEHSLKLEAEAVGMELVSVLQSRVMVCGARIISFSLNELSYSPEIASAMLKRQQAQAMVAARHTIVEGAVNICRDAVNGLERNGITMSDSEKCRIVGNLLVVIAGDQDPQPVVGL